MHDCADFYECLGIIYYLAFITDFARDPVLKSEKHKRTVYPRTPQILPMMSSENATVWTSTA